MRDEIDGRLWTEHGSAFGEALAELARQVKLSLAKLHEIQFDAPWRRKTTLI